MTFVGDKLRSFRYPTPNKNKTKEEAEQKKMRGPVGYFSLN